MTERTYALVENGEIIQFPLTNEDINALNSPSSQYVRCYYDEPPVFDINLEYLIEKPRNVGDSIIILYEVKKISIDDKFTELRNTASSEELDTNGIPYIDITLVTPDLFNSVLTLVKQKVQLKLDAFATTRGYDDMRSVCTYFSSLNPVYKAEADRAIELRDGTWASLYSYLEDLIAGQAHAPRTWLEVEAMLPNLTW